MPVVGLGGASTIALLAATLPGPLGGRTASARATRLAYIGHGPLTSAHHATTAPTATPKPVAATKPARVTNPATAPKPAATAKPAGATATAKPAATVARSPQTANHFSRPSGQPYGSGGATPGSVTQHTHTATPHPAAASGGAVIYRRHTATGTTSSGYVNPLAHASVTPERIDQGVDYGGTGSLAAIGAGRITYIGTSGTGWPGAFIEFRLSAGSDAGRYVYYAESIVPAQGLHVGQEVRAGQTIATLTGASGGIEIGWGAGIGTETYAMEVGQWKPGMDADSVPTASGKSFSALIASLRGPAGKIEG